MFHFKLLLVFSVVGLLSIGQAWAATYEEGYEAYKAEHYDSAAKIWSSEELGSDIRALFSLGRLYMNGKGVEVNQQKAVEYYQKAADGGHLSAQFNLGLAYFKGAGVSKNIEQAMALWRGAAEAGHDGAQYNVGALLWQGELVEQDQATAMEWFRQSSSNGNSQAKRFLGSLFSPMHSELRDNLTYYSEKNSSRTISVVEELGLYKLAQQAYSKQEFKQAFKYWLPLAEDGHPDSQFKVAMMYENGQGIEENFDEAIMLYQKAANAGQSDAQYRIGLYHMTESTEPNKTLGLYWIQSAADNNNLEAQAYLNN